MFTARKPCSFAGKKFSIGETIPAGMVHPTAVGRLIKSGVIAEAGAGPLLPATPSIEPEKVWVPILTDEGEAEIDMTIEDLLVAVKAIQMPDDELIEMIKTIESEDVLILVDVIRGNSDNPAIHEAAHAKATEDIPETEEALMKLNRDQLVEIAQGLGKEVIDADTKKVLVAYILEAKAGSNE